MSVFRPGGRPDGSVLFRRSTRCLAEGPLDRPPDQGAMPEPTQHLAEGSQLGIRSSAPLVCVEVLLSQGCKARFGGRSKPPPVLTPEHPWASGSGSCSCSCSCPCPCPCLFLLPSSRPPCPHHNLTALS
ncbi:uncharacterized protein RHO17_004594 [Thomomys bottae]